MKKHQKPLRWLKRLVYRLRCYLTDKEELFLQNEQLYDLVRQCGNINQSLNIALGESLSHRQMLTQEYTTLLAGLTLQNNGEILLPKTFLDAVADGGMKLVYGEEDEGKTVTLRLEEVKDEPEPKVEEEEEEAA